MYRTTTQLTADAFNHARVYRAGQPTGGGDGLPLEADDDFAPPPDSEKTKDDAKKSDTKDKKPS